MISNSNDKHTINGNIVNHESAGGFLFYKNASDELYVAILEKEDGDYYMPKGHIQEGETPEEAATRELIEELGLKVTPKLLKFVCTDSYTFELPDDKRLHQKLVYVYSFEVDEPVELAPLAEEKFKGAKWVTIPDAIKLLSYDSKSLQKAIDSLPIDS